MDMPNASRTATGNNGSTERKQTHLEMLVQGAQNNEKRLQALQEFSIAILNKIRGNGVPTAGTPRPDSIGGTLGQLEESICNSGDSINTLEVVLAELDATI